MASIKKPQLDKSEVIEELPVACASEAAAVAFFENKRWGDSPCCPECGDTNVYTMKDRKTGERNKDFRWRCRGCGKLYTVRTGMIFEESLIPLHKWARACWESASCKNGVSALELSRKIQVSYKTALFMMQRIRFCMAEHDPNPPKLEGTVEADETFVGGKPRGSRRWKHGQANPPRAKYTSKTPVLAVLQRGGKVRTRVVAAVTSANLMDFLGDNVQPGSKLMTDELPKYRKVARPVGLEHGFTNHSKREYVNPENPNIHTNTAEGYFSRVKRCINGTWHAVSKEHLHRYMSHTDWLYNSRELNDGERALDLIRRADGKRLRYKQPA